MSNPAVTSPRQRTGIVPPAASPTIQTLERWPDPGSGVEGLVPLNRNERAEPLPEWLVARIRKRITGELLTSYPDTEAVYEELAGWLGVQREQVLLSTGSDGGIKAVYQTFIQPGDGVVSLKPSYAMYSVYTEMFQGRFTGVPIQNDLSIDPGSLLDAIVPGVRLVMIANPNQPTGTLADESLLLKVLEKAGEVGALVGIDEAYHPFSQFTILPRLEEFPNLVVIRTFSKAAGLAGLRVGYLVGHHEVIGNVAKVRTIGDVNSIAAVCAQEVIRAPEIIYGFVAEAEEGKRILSERASALGLEPLPSAAGFMLIQVTARCEPQALIDALVELGYLVRGPFQPPIADCIRVTLAPPALMGAFAEALEQAVERLTSSFQG